MTRAASPAPSRPTREARAVTGFLAMLAGRQTGGLLEARARTAGGMTQRFYAPRELPRAAGELLELGQRTDVYVGCVPRVRPAGDATALGQAWVLWADCDDEPAVERLAAFDPRPSVIVRSGSGANAHAYWSLLRPVDAEQAVLANRRLAHALGADPRSAEAARILRVPGSLNFKHRPPTPVALERCKPARRYLLAVVTGGLADPPAAPAPVMPGRRAPTLAGDDPLRQVPPAVFVEVLTGLAVGRDRKVSCPFHADTDPSLHVYEQPEDGWYCYGCERGGSIYDLAAQLDGIIPRKREFLKLRDRLQRTFAAWTPEPPA